MSDTEDAEFILRQEQLGSPGTFLYDLRCSSVWNETAFDKLFKALKAYCKQLSSCTTLDRDISELVWYLSWYPRSQLEHLRPDQRSRLEPAVTNLDHIAWWFFAKSVRDDDQFERLAFAEPGIPTASLQQPTGTSIEQPCHCDATSTVLLMARYESSPLVCAKCNMSRPIANVDVPQDLSLELRRWHKNFEALYQLWIDSGSYASFAKANLESTKSPIVLTALDLTRRLNTYLPAYYFNFEDLSAEDSEEAATCPACGASPTIDSSRRVCVSCRIALS